MNLAQIRLTLLAITLLLSTLFFMPWEISYREEYRAQGRLPEYADVNLYRIEYAPIFSTPASVGAPARLMTEVSLMLWLALLLAYLGIFFSVSDNVKIPELEPPPSDKKAPDDKDDPS